MTMLRPTLSALIAATVLSTMTAPAAHATDSLRQLADVSHALAEAAAEELIFNEAKGAKSNMSSTRDKTGDALVQNIRG
jgi:hypothetical protein